MILESLGDGGVGRVLSTQQVVSGPTSQSLVMPQLRLLFINLNFNMGVSENGVPYLGSL